MLKRSAKKLLKKLGFKIHRIQSNQKLEGETGEKLILPNSLSADLIIDIGVAGGTPWLYSRFSDASLVLIEPLNVVGTLKDMLQGRKYEFYECAAGNQEGEILINFDRDRPSLSSIHDRSKLTSRNHEIEKKRVKIRTLDSILKESNYTIQNVGLKIDTEGHELEVLKGAVDTLKLCQFVICEVSIEKRFEASYDFTELVCWMHEHGFKVSKILKFAVDVNHNVRMADVLFEPF